MARYAKSKCTLVGTFDIVRQKLSEMALGDQSAEKQSNQGGKWLLTGVILVLVGFFLSLFAAKNNWPDILLQGGEGSIGLGVCASLVAMVLMGHSSSYNLDNPRYQIPTELLDMIAVDLDPNKTMSVIIDFRNSTDSRFRKSVVQPSFLFIRWGRKVTTYLHPWLEVSATTTAGYRWKLTVTRKTILKEKPKTKRTKLTVVRNDCLRLIVRRPGSGLALEPRPLAEPQGSRLQNFRGQQTGQGAVATALRPGDADLSGNFGSASLTAPDLAALMLSCFQALHQQST